MDNTGNAQHLFVGSLLSTCLGTHVRQISQCFVLHFFLASRTIIPRWRWTASRRMTFSTCGSQSPPRRGAQRLRSFPSCAQMWMARWYATCMMRALRLRRAILLWYLGRMWPLTCFWMLLRSLEIYRLAYVCSLEHFWGDVNVNEATILKTSGVVHLFATFDRHDWWFSDVLSSFPWPGEGVGGHEDDHVVEVPRGAKGVWGSRQLQ